MEIKSTEMDMARERTIKLDFPIQLADRVLNEITMRRPIMRDMVNSNIQANKLDQDMALIAKLCNLTPDDLELMDTCDYDKLQNQLFRFRGVSITI